MNQENLNHNHLENTLDNLGETKPKDNLLGTLSKCLALAPLMLEQFTGQKVPQMSGTMAEIQQGMIQLTTNLQLVINNQNKIWQKLINLENNASQKLVNLTNKIDKISTVKLTHEREKKQIEYGSNQNRLGNQEFE